MGDHKKIDTCIHNAFAPEHLRAGYYEWRHVLYLSYKTHETLYRAILEVGHILTAIVYTRDESDQSTWKLDPNIDTRLKLFRLLKNPLAQDIYFSRNSFRD